jgi:parvulin-like peptidyl-prolyl isomerase
MQNRDTSCGRITTQTTARSCWKLETYRIQPSFDAVAIETKKTTFAEAVTKESEDNATRSKGGDLGFIKRGDILKPLEDAVFATKPGMLTAVAEADNGCYLFDVLEVKPAGRMSLETAKPKIRDYLLHKANQAATRKHLDGLKAKTKIETVMSDEEWNKRHAAK